MLTHEEKPASKTRQRIVDASLELFVSQGIAATTTRDIAERAGIAEGTIYRHFESKDALATEMFLEGYLPLADALLGLERRDGPLLDRLEHIVAHFYRLFDEDQTRWVYVMTYQTGPQSKLPAGTPTPYSLMLKMLTESLEAGELKNIDPHLMTQILLGIIQQPAAGVVYEELDGPLAARVPDVMLAIRRVLNL